MCPIFVHLEPDHGQERQEIPPGKKLYERQGHGTPPLSTHPLKEDLDQESGAWWFHGVMIPRGTSIPGELSSQST